jgi:hypothetical protein
MLTPLTGQLGPLGSGRGRIPKPVLWLRADSIVGIDDGDPVASWADISGNELDAADVYEEPRPLYKTEIVNGKPIVRFDTEDKFLSCPDSALLEPADTLTVFAVAAIADVGAQQASLFGRGSLPDNPPAWGLAFSTAEGVTSAAVGIRTNLGTYSLFVPVSLTLNAFYVWVITYRPVPAGIGVSLRQNGVELDHSVFAGTALSSSGADFSIGNIGFYVSLLHDLAELRVYGALPNERYVHKVEHMLGARYGITIP